CVRVSSCSLLFFFFFSRPATTEIYTLSLHDALPILQRERAAAPVDDVERREGGGGRAGGHGSHPASRRRHAGRDQRDGCDWCDRSEEHTSELQSQSNLVCRLLLEKKKKIKTCY